MAVRVVLDVPSAGGLARVLRGLGLLVGSALVVAAVLAAIYPLLLGLVALSLLLNGDTIEPLSSSDLLGLAVSLGAVVVGSWVGVRLIRGRRRPGLYLRKFGYGDATRAVTEALHRGVGRRVRFVTLDDAMVAPLGVSKTPRRIAGLVCVVGAAVAVWWSYWAIGGPGDRAFDATGDFSEAVGVIITMLLALFGASLFGSIAIFAGGAYRAARRAEQLTRQTIVAESAIAPTARRIARLSRRVLSPRLVVVRVATPIWQQTVRGLAGVCDVVVIDVSHPTDALVWEVTTMKPLFGDRWVLVGAYDQVSMLADPRTGLDGDPRGLLARLLDGQEVLAYGHTPADHQRFVRALRNRLHQAGARRGRPVAQPAAVG